jgi:hypothetical protein
MPQIKPEDLIADQSDIEQDAEEFFEQDIETLVTSITVLGQLDPTEVDLTAGLPRWTPDQMSLITKARGKLDNWRE